MMEDLMNELKELKEEVANEKLTFTSGAYASYGYNPAAMTWLDFIKAVYGADNENELCYLGIAVEAWDEFKVRDEDRTYLSDITIVESPEGVVTNGTIITLIFMMISSVTLFFNIYLQ